MGLSIRFSAIFVALVLVFPLSYAALITGLVYDRDFNLLKNVVVEITTNPKQIYVAKNGSYEFLVTDGRYTLSAYFRIKNGTTIFTSKDIYISGGGDYKVDLILDKIYNGSLPEIPSQKNVLTSIIRDNIVISLAVALLMALSLTIVIFFKHRKSTIVVENKELDDRTTVMKIIKDNGGRIAQKDLRKQLAQWSEAKVSLVVSELEVKGLIEKIKKGRGNILIIKNG